MKKLPILITIALLLACVPAKPAFAHDLLPKQVVEFLVEHPNATPEEIQVYAQTLDPEIAAKFSRTEDVIRVVRNRDTNLWDNALDFLKLGIGHILSGPDHVLFILSLLLVFASVYELLKLATTFTIAHSITLVLAGTGVLLLSPRISEPLIALSIACMAIISVFFKDFRFAHDERFKPAIVFFFGLFHGLGFAGLLKEIEIPADKFISSLFAFNVGIEIGQLIVIGCALPFIFYFRNRAWYHRAIQVFAVIISATAFLWFVQRILGM